MDDTELPNDMVPPGTPEQSPQNSIQLGMEVDEMHPIEIQSAVTSSFNRTYRESNTLVVSPPVFNYTGSIGSLNSNAKSSSSNFSSPVLQGTNFVNANSQSSGSPSSVHSPIILAKGQDDDDGESVYDNVAGSVDGLTPHINNTPHQVPPVMENQMPPGPPPPEAERISSIQSDDSDLSLMYGRGNVKKQTAGV